MRLGTYPTKLVDNTVAKSIYKDEIIYERHRHRYEVNNKYREQLSKSGMVFSGLSPDNELIEIIELDDHPFFMGSQFHPEFKSRPGKPSPLFNHFIAAAKKFVVDDAYSSSKVNSEVNDWVPIKKI